MEYRIDKMYLDRKKNQLFIYFVSGHMFIMQVQGIQDVLRVCQWFHGKETSNEIKQQVC